MTCVWNGRAAGRAIGVVLLSPIPMAGPRVPGEAFEMFRSLGEAGPEQFRGFRQQTAPSAPEAEVQRLTTVAAKLRPEVVRTVADMWNNGHPASERIGAAVVDRQDAAIVDHIADDRSRGAADAEGSTVGEWGSTDSLDAELWKSSKDARVAKFHR